MNKVQARATRLLVSALAAVSIDCGPNPGDRNGNDGSALPDGGTQGSDGSSHNPREMCGNGLDDDGNGQIDEGCACTPGAMQSCYPGNPARIGVGPCAAGHQTCSGEAEFTHWGECLGAVLPAPELCDRIDNDCDGTVDNVPGGTPCQVIEVPVDIDGDCVTVSCPPQAPYPVGCNITMAGNDTRGCVASTPTGSMVYFQEGDRCGVGRVRGTLLCANIPGMGLNAQNCQINKPERFYPPDRSGCPRTN